SSVMLLPAWVVIVRLWLLAGPDRDAWKRPRHLLAIALPLVVACLALPRILAIAVGYDLSHHILTTETGRAGGIAAAALSRRHFLDLTNLMLALSPLAFAIPLLTFRSRDPRRAPSIVLGVLAASFVPALLIIEPQQGTFRDWDVFAPAGVAFSLLAAYGLGRALEQAPARRWLAASALAVCALSSFQWLALNRDDARGLERVRAYLLERPGPEDV